MCSETLISTGTSWCNMNVSEYMEEYQPMRVMVIYADGHVLSRSRWEFEDVGDVVLTDGSSNGEALALVRTDKHYWQDVEFYG